MEFTSDTIFFLINLSLLSVFSLLCLSFNLLRFRHNLSGNFLSQTLVMVVCINLIAVLSFNLFTWKIMPAFVVLYVGFLKSTFYADKIDFFYFQTPARKLAFFISVIFLSVPSLFLKSYFAYAFFLCGIFYIGAIKRLLSKINNYIIDYQILAERRFRRQLQQASSESAGVLSSGMRHDAKLKVVDSGRKSA